MLGLAGIYSGMGDYGDEVSATKDLYRYNGKTIHRWGPGGIFTEVAPAHVFTHHLTIDVPVKHGESANFSVMDKIKPISAAYDGAEWLNKGANNRGTWYVNIPAYGSDEDPTKMLPWCYPNETPL